MSVRHICSIFALLKSLEVIASQTEAALTIAIAVVYMYS